MKKEKLDLVIQGVDMTLADLRRSLMNKEVLNRMDSPCKLLTFCKIWFQLRHQEWHEEMNRMEDYEKEASCFH